MGRLSAVALFSILSAAGKAHTQVEIFPKPWANPDLWDADTLWVGASFTRATTSPVTVSLKGNEAGWTGDLFFIDPRTGVEDRLFSNHDPVGTTVVLSDRHDIALGDTLYFVYRVTQPVDGIYPSAASRLPKYTGPNTPGQSRYVAQPTNPMYGHRWSVAGRANDSIVEFGFEDNVEPTGSDYDFDDIVFRTTLSLLSNETPARLFFADKAGNPLPENAFLSPDADSLYLVYTDDYVLGNIRKEISLTIRNRRGAAPGDSEKTTVLPLVRTGDAGTWRAAVSLEEAGGIPGDVKAQTWILGEATAEAASHDRLGRPDGGKVSAHLQLAYPDSPESLRVLACPDPAAAIDGSTACITVTAGDQSFTRHADTVWAELGCARSGDRIARVPLFEAAPGSYASLPVVKNEGAAAPADQILSCLATDTVIASYADEVYGGKASARAGWIGALAAGAYIKDADGDGRGDKVYVVFAQPLAAPPASVTPLYWNEAKDDAEHAFTGIPKAVSLDPARPNVVVIDLANAPFPEAFTGIPAGAAPPYATIPAANGFASGKPLIADSLGPILLRAEIHPYLAGGGPGNQNADTLSVRVSEKLSTRDGAWMDLLRVGTAEKGRCVDYANAVRLVPAGAPALDSGDLVYTYLIGDGMTFRTLAGDCAYLNVDGSYADLPGNLPPIHGKIISGRLPPRRIEVMEGYPPVAGADPRIPGSTAPVGGPPPAFGGTPGAQGGLEWIPPADWPAGYVPGLSTYAPEAHAPGDPIQPGSDPGRPGPMPWDIGAVQIVSTGDYIAEVSIFDNLGNWVTDFSQAFGYRGELGNAFRRAASGKGLVSYLAWNLKDSRGRKAGNGAYIWKIRFVFGNGKQEVRYVRTGVTRNRPR